tara:strand:- start:715 stop:1014 length:300 start_codon:yes stop_codon:yes gene_type:complete
MNKKEVITLTSSGDSSNIGWAGGKGSIQFSGTFSSKTIKIQASIDDVNYVTLSNYMVRNGVSTDDIAITANTIVPIDIGRCRLRFNASGAMTGVKVYIS